MMTIKMTASGETLQVNDSYALRLIAFGYAVKDTEPADAPEEPAQKEEKSRRKAQKE